MCSGNKKNSQERWIASITLVLVLVGFFIGLVRNSEDVYPYLNKLMPNTTSFKNTGLEAYTAFSSDAQETATAYIATGEFDGFGGPLKMLTAIDTTGKIISCEVIEQRETSSWYRRVMDAGILETLRGKTCRDPFVLGQDVDGVTGATYTSRAIVESVKQASRQIANENLHLNLADDADNKFTFGFPEISLILLFILGYIARGRGKKYLTRIRWFSLISGLLIIGCIINYQITIVDFSKLFMGYWPNFYNHVYWYILVWGVILIYTVTGKNIYCQWICPFGAAQECIGAIGKAKAYSGFEYKATFKWIRWAIVWFAVISAFIFRNPGIASYEVYGTLFDLSGTNSQFILLIVILGAALLIKLPWCNYICPVPVFQNFAGIFRRWVLEIIKGKKA